MRMTNTVLEFERLEHEWQNNPQPYNEYPEDGAVRSSQEQARRLLMDAGGSQVADAGIGRARPSSMVRKLLSARASTGPNILVERARLGKLRQR